MRRSNSCRRFGDGGRYRSPRPFFILGIALCLCQIVGVSAAQDKPVRKARPAKPPIAVPATNSSGPFTLPQTLEYARDLSNSKPLARQQLYRQYESKGIDFKATSDILKRIKLAGADDEFLNVITKLGAPPPPPPPPVINGSVEVSCAPAECDVAINKQPPVSTVSGKFVFEGVPAGEVTLSFSKAGYIGVPKQVKVQPGARASAAATLEENGETRAKNARALLARVWDVLGAGDRGAALQQVTASGTVSLFDLNGKETLWNVTAKVPSSFELQLPSGKQAFKFLCDPSCHIGKSSGNPFAGRGKASIDPEEVSILLAKLRTVQLGNMISRLTSPEVRLMSTEAKPSGDRTFVLEGNDESYELEVGPSLLLNHVFVKAKYGGEVYQVTYGDYVKLSESAQYPRRTEYRMQTNKRAVKIEFTSSVSKTG